MCPFCVRALMSTEATGVSQNCRVPEARSRRRWGRVRLVVPSRDGRGPKESPPFPLRTNTSSMSSQRRSPPRDRSRRGSRRRRMGAAEATRQALTVAAARRRLPPGRAGLRRRLTTLAARGSPGPGSRATNGGTWPSSRPRRTAPIRRSWAATRGPLETSGSGASRRAKLRAAVRSWRMAQAILAQCLRARRDLIASPHSAG
jgi:hypothetical protein